MSLSEDPFAGDAMSTPHSQQVAQDDVPIGMIAPTMASITRTYNMNDCAAECKINRTRLKQCAQCYAFAYCSKTCQKTDWEETDKWECKILARVASTTATSYPSSISTTSTLDDHGSEPFPAMYEGTSSVCARRMFRASWQTYTKDAT
jgi:radical SAM protein with 4Fe4S-binding SPASM domain